jgi:hypothetical protein
VTAGTGQMLSKVILALGSRQGAVCLVRHLQSDGQGGSTLPPGQTQLSPTLHRDSAGTESTLCSNLQRWPSHGQDSGWTAAEEQ